jgi:hypothetical protein
MREREEEIRNINRGMHQVNEIYKVSIRKPEHDWLAGWLAGWLFMDTFLEQS